MKKLIIICLFILAIPVLTGCDKVKDNAGAAFKDSSPAPKASVAAKPAKEEAATENGKPFEYKEPDHAFFKVANHKKEYLPEERTEELITLPNDMAVVRHITYQEPEDTNGYGRSFIEKCKEEGKTIVYSKVVLLDKKTKKETQLLYNGATNDSGLPFIIDAIVSDDLTECRCISVSDLSAWLFVSDLKNPDLKSRTIDIPLVPTKFRDYSEVYFVTPSVVHVKVEVPEEKIKPKSLEEKINGIEYYIETYRAKTKDDHGKEIERLGRKHVWYNKKHYDYFHSITTEDRSGYSAFDIRGEYKDMPLPEFDMNEWKGWTRMNFDKKTLIK